MKHQPVLNAHAAKSLPELRGIATEYYSQLESALCSLLSFFGEMPEEVAGTIFYRINNARARNTILCSLKRRKIGADYASYWNSLIKLVGELDQARNEIIHWRTVVEIGHAGRTEVLRPSTFWHTQSADVYTLERLVEFCAKCDFVARALNYFGFTLRYPDALDGIPQDEADAWRRIMQQPVSYPPPHNHPLCQS